MEINLRDLGVTIIDHLGLKLNGQDLSDVRFMVQRRDEGSLLGFFGERIEGGLNREHHIAVSNLLADFGAK